MEQELVEGNLEEARKRERVLESLRHELELQLTNRGTDLSS